MFDIIKTIIHPYNCEELARVRAEAAAVRERHKQLRESVPSVIDDLAREFASNK